MKGNINIDKETLTEVVKMVLSEQDKQQHEKAKRRRDRRLRNTDLLLRNYDNLITHIKQAVEAERIIEEDPEELLESIESEAYTEEDYEGVYVGAIKRTKARTRIIVQHIETALEFYRVKNSDKLHQRRFKVINMYYCEKKKISEIAEELNIDDRTVWRDKGRAIEELSVLFFGIDGIKFTI